MSTDQTWPRGTVGTIRSQHREDGHYSAPAVLTHDSPPDQELIEVELRDAFYCLETGEKLQTQRYLFTPRS